MTHATHTLDQMRPPYPAEPGSGVYSNKLGMWVFLASDVMFFTALIGSYVILRFGVSSPWAQPGAVLNVPLYVFGRLDEMKHHYYAFKGLAKRSKVLHIDKNWEDSLPDLDPDSAQALHRQEMVREHIVNFATLLTLPDAPRIIRREGHYYLRDPDDAEALTELGATLSAAGTSRVLAAGE